MSVETVIVSAEETDVRLDRWFKRHYPTLAHGRLEKLLRTGQVRVDGKRARSHHRLSMGQMIRVPPLGEVGEGPRAKPAVSEEDAIMLRGCVLHQDDQVIILDKPPGLATQGGTGTVRHVDGMLDALRFGFPERPRLVHRLDKDTSGVLVIGRSLSATAALAKAFQGGTARKIYWALVVGRPEPSAGTIKAPIAKMKGAHGERMEVNPYEGRHAVTDFKVLESAARTAAWVQMAPRTGRTHQLRVHMAHLGTPIAGDGKYANAEKTLRGALSGKLHLHARAIEMPHPAGGVLRAVAPLPRHMRESFEFFDFDCSKVGDFSMVGDSSTVGDVFVRGEDPSLP